MRRRNDFIATFLLPLVEGGEVHVGAPLGAGGLGRLLQEAGDAAVESHLQDVRLSVAAALQLAPAPPLLDDEALRLAVSVHDLLFLFHPVAASAAGSGRGDRFRRVVEGATTLARLPPSSDSDTLVARHTVLHLFPSLSRTDVRVSFWAGRHEFRGQQPPPRMTAWPGLRRVHEERWRVSCLTEAATDVGGGAEVLRALFTASPLTDLLSPLRLEPRLNLSRLGAVLREPEVCRMVSYRYLEEGLGSVGGALAQATVALCSEKHPDGAAFALAFLCHLHLCLLSAAERGEPHLELVRLAGRGDSSLRDFCGLYPTVKHVAPALFGPPDLARDARMSRLAGEHALACAEACGSARMHELAALVARALGTTGLAAA